MRIFSRRRFVTLVSRLLGATGLGLSLGGCRQTPEEVEEILLGCLEGAPRAPEIGEVYLGGTPEESDRRLLVELIVPEAGSGRDRAEKIRQQLLGAIRDDFSNSRTVRLHNWVLSVTEARLYALSHLALSSTPKR